MDILDFLKKNKEARMVFGSKELKIVEKQILGLPLTASEKTRLSRDIRKKFDFIKDVARYSDEFDLKKGARIKAYISEAVEVIKESKYFPYLKKIILFGSAVENRLRLDSDIDIAAEFKKINKKQAVEFRIKTLSKLPDKVDVQVYNVLPKKIKKQIDKNGKVLYEK